MCRRGRAPAPGQAQCGPSGALLRPACAKIPSVDPIQPGAGPQAPVQLPAKLGNYRIEERLGSGGMGIVYRAFDEVLERPLAIKHLHAQKTNPTASLRFRREARAAARLNHPAIVHICLLYTSDAADEL